MEYDEDYIVRCVKQLPRKILRIIETEFGAYKESHPESIKEIEGMFKRLRKSILDELGDVTRMLEE